MESEVSGSQARWVRITGRTSGVSERNGEEGIVDDGDGEEEGGRGDGEEDGK